MFFCKVAWVRNILGIIIVNKLFLIDSHCYVICTHTNLTGYPVKLIMICGGKGHCLLGILSRIHSLVQPQHLCEYKLLP